MNVFRRDHKRLRDEIVEHNKCQRNESYINPEWKDSFTSQFPGLDGCHLPKAPQRDECLLVDLQKKSDISELGNHDFAQQLIDASNRGQEIQIHTNGIDLLEQRPFPLSPGLFTDVTPSQLTQEPERPLMLEWRPKPQRAEHKIRVHKRSPQDDDPYNVKKARMFGAEY